MKLYYFPGSCALAPHIVLEWIGTDYQPVRITKGDPDYLKVNPLGTVPALEDDGRIMTQADAILQYLADKYPEVPLGADDDIHSRFALHQWLAFMTGDLHPAFFPFFGPQRFTVHQDEASVQAVKQASYARVDKYYRHLDRHLEDREYIVGERASIADAYAVPMIRWGKMLPDGLAPYPNLSRFYTAMSDEPGVQAALQQQGLSA